MKTPSTTPVLHVEDSPTDALLIREELEHHRQFHLTQVDRLEEALRVLATGHYAVVLLDLGLPDSQGLDTLVRLHRAVPHVPVVVVTSSDDEELGLRAVQAGAADYLVKSQIREYLLARTIQYAIERKRAAQVLRSSEELFRGAFEHTNVAMVLTDLNHRFKRVNAAFAQLFGYSLEETLALSMGDITHPDHLAESYEQRKALLAGESSFFQMEKRYLHKDGHTLWGLTNVSLVRDSGSQPALYVGQVQDITERKRAEAALRGASDFNRQIIASAQEGIIVLDRDLRYRVWNTYMEALSGLNSKDVLDKHPWQAVPLFSEADYRASLEPVLAGEAVNLPDLFVPAPPPGRTAWVWQQLSPWRDTIGRIIGVICVVRDITERKRAESVLREQSLLASLTADVGQAFTSGGTAREMLQCCVESMVRNLDAAFARIWTLSPRENILELQASAGLYTHTDGPHSRVPVGKYKIGLIAEEKEPHLTNDVAHDSRIGDPAWATREGMVAFAGYPLLVENRLVGVMAMFARQNLTEATLQAMAAVANQIAVGIERKQTEMRLRHLLQSSPAVIYSLALEAEQVRVSWISDNIESLMGYEAAECLLPDWWQPRVHSDDLPEVLDRWPALIRDGHSTLEFRFRHKDGAYRWVRDELQLLRDAEGNPEECVGSWSDITERKRAEAEVRRATDLLRAVADGTTDAVFVKDLDGKHLLFNEAAARFVGKSVAEAMGEDDTALFDPHSARLVMERDRRVMAAGIVATEEETLTAAGVTRTFLSTKGPYRDVHGKVAGVLGISRDITDRKRAEEALRQSEALKAAIVESALDCIVTMDSEGRIVEFNSAAERSFGHSRAAVLGKPVAEVIIPPAFRERHATGLAHYLATGEGPVLGRLLELTGLRADGKEFPLELSITPVQIGGQRHFTAFLRDLTQRRRLEEQFRQAQKMEAIGRLAGGVAHDFNNLLTVISGYSEVLLGSVPAKDPAHKLLQEIQKAGVRAASLTGQLLAFSRKQVLDTKVLDLNAIVRDSEKMLKRLVGEDVELTAVLVPALGKVKTDPGQVEQVLMNLVVNARDAMPQGGKITIETVNVVVDEAYVSSQADVKPGRYVMLSVSDSGSGMDEQTRARIFEPFFTTKELGKGTGLGLAMVHGFITQSGGHVFVYSEVGLGTTFKIYLPEVEAIASSEKSQAEILKMPRGNETILLVEDESAVRALTRYVLQSCGYSVLEAARGDEAIRLAEKHQGPIALLITDVVMPGLGGRMVAERVMALNPSTRVLYLSGYTDDAVVRHGVLQSETAFLQKPFTPSDLAIKVRKVLDALSPREDSPSLESKT